MPIGPKVRRSNVFSPMEETAIVTLRGQGRLPLDDVYIALKGSIPHLTRSSLHRCLQRYRISRLPKADQEKPKKFKDCEIGCFYIDIAAGFLKAPIRWVPYKIHTILTDNGVQFVQRERGAKGLTFPHILGRVCLENGIQHRLTKPYHPRAYDQVERMVCTIKEATVKSLTMPRSRNCVEM